MPSVIGQAVSLWWIFFTLIAIACLLGARAFIGYRQLPTKAIREWEYRKANNINTSNATQEQFCTAYQRIHAPRASLYIALLLLSICVATPLTIMLLDYILLLSWQISGQSRVIEKPFLVWSFLMLFGIVFVWVFISAQFSRHYHKHSPQSLHKEIVKERAKTFEVSV